MKGLILKDFINLKSQTKTLGLILLVFMAISLPSGGVQFVLGYTVLVLAMLVITSISFDHVAKWDKYALTMPISRSDIVLSKYILLLLNSAIGALIGFILTFISSFITKQFNLLETTIAVIMVISVAIIYGSIMLPIIYKFGPEKAKLIIILVAVLPTLLITTGSEILKTAQTNISINNVVTALGYIIPVLAFVSIIVSYYISVNIYKKKEF